MADDDDDDDLDLEDDDDGEDYDEDEDGEGAPRRKGSKKKLFIMVGGTLLLVVGGLAAAYFTDLLDPLIDMVTGGETELAEEQERADIETVFFPVQELMVNLNTTGRKSTFLKIRINLELESAEDIPKIEAVMPRIMNSFQVYLRELRIEDLKGSAGIYRLREELLTRVSAAVAPIPVRDVLLQEMLVQ